MEQAPKDRGDDGVQNREKRGVHRGRDLAKELFGLAARRLGRALALARPLGHRRLNPGAAENTLGDLVTRSQRGALHDFLFAREQDQGETTEFAHPGIARLLGAIGHELT